ncbi:hypothetical protein D9611_003943 [Ephemerocybe angulata]|uniref:Uncharacterized protein n=1 Tax=Ephemerocybe angulata TaxID=980116 RepID=A0A8H5B5I9_9AGAR|nr:hypothetical protein D9611_003943 [Tulosesus angulatus]
MYTDCVASSSRLPIQDIWDPPLSGWSFPLSDCRYESFALDTQTRRPSAASQQSTAKSPAQPVPPAATATRYPTFIPPRKQLSPGVYNDGKNTTYSSALPEVQRFLATARSTLTLPTVSSDLILTLAALEVFYKPADPVHWLFWSDEKKNVTADVVTRITLHNPPLIVSPVCWTGKNEYLALLASHHGVSWRPFYEHKPWFTVVCPPKPSTPPRQLNLRKRRVVPGALKEPSRSPGPEDMDVDELPVARRAGTNSRAPSPELMEEAPAPKKRVQRSRAARTKPKPPTPSPPSSLPNSPEPSVLTLSPEQDLGLLSADVDPATTEIATRSKRKTTLPSRYPQPLSCSQEMDLPIDSSLLLGPAVNPQMADQLLSGHSRTRSTSTDSSGKTAVASDVSRSASVASGETAVDAASPSKKRKSSENDDENLEDLKGDSLDLAGADEEGEDDDSASVAHGRAKRTRKVPANGSPDDAASEKMNSGRAPGTSARPSRKKARKA